MPRLLIWFDNSRPSYSTRCFSNLRAFAAAVAIMTSYYVSNSMRYYFKEQTTAVSNYSSASCCWPGRRPLISAQSSAFAPFACGYCLIVSC